MRYQVLKRTFGSHGAIEISAEEFQGIRIAKRGLLAALGIEEKFNLLLENFAEFEAELLNLSLRHLVFADVSWSSFQGDIYTVNQRMVNLLSSTRLYRDHLLHELSELYGRDADILGEMKSRLTNEYDSSLAFRSMDVIRNHLQHRSFPVHGLTFRGSREESEGSVWARHSASPSLSVSELRADPKVKRSVVAELAALGNEVCVTPLVREYVEALGRVHEAVRTAIASDVRRWEAQMSRIVERGKATFGDVVGLAAVRVEGRTRRPKLRTCFLTSSTVAGFSNNVAVMRRTLRTIT